MIEALIVKHERSWQDIKGILKAFKGT